MNIRPRLARLEALLADRAPAPPLTDGQLLAGINLLLDYRGPDPDMLRRQEGVRAILEGARARMLAARGAGGAHE